MAYNRNVRNSGMSRGQFIRTAGVGAAALGAASMGMGGVARAATPPEYALNVYVGLNANTTPPDGLIPDATDYGSYAQFFQDVYDATGIQMMLVPPTHTGANAKSALNVANGLVLMSSGLSMQAGALPNGYPSKATDLFWHQPFMKMNLNEFIMWYYRGGGKELRQKIINAQYGVTANGNPKLVVLPYRINPGEGGGWFTKPIEQLVYDATQPNAVPWKMRVSGPLLMGIMSSANIGVDLVNAVAGAAEAWRLIPTDPLPVQGFEFHIASADNGVMLWPKEVYNMHVSQIPGIHYYVDCWWSAASVFEFWINGEFYFSEGAYAETGLNAYQRAVFEEAAENAVFDNLRKTKPKQHSTIDTWRYAGTTVHQKWPSEVLAKLEAAKELQFANWLQTDSWFKQVYDSMAAFLGKKL